MIQSKCNWLVGLAVFLWCTSPIANAAPAAETTVLTQKCTAIGGTYTVYLSKNNVRIDSPSLVIFAQAPKWSVTVLKPNKKIYFQSDYKACLKLLRSARAPFSTIAESSSSKWRKAPAEVIAGCASEQWCSDSTDKGRIKCWTLSEPRFAPQCAEIMDTCYGIPSPGNGIPLRFFYTGSGNSLLPMPSRHYDSDGRRQQEYRWLDTVGTKKIQTSNTLFAIPKGFKPTKDYAEIAVDGDTHNVDAAFILKDLSKHPEALFDSR
jgi:hypothetical protein